MLAYASAVDGLLTKSVFRGAYILCRQVTVLEALKVNSESLGYTKPAHNHN
jgi:hypothetical protein